MAVFETKVLFCAVRALLEKYMFYFQFALCKKHE